MIYPGINSNRHAYRLFTIIFSSYKEPLGLCNNNNYVDCQPITRKIGTYQTGRFVIPSVRDNNYIIIIFDLESNSIFADPTPNRTKQYIKNSYVNILKILKNIGLKLQLYRLENEASYTLQEFITEQHTAYKLTTTCLN